MKTTHSKMKALKWSKHFSRYKSMGIFRDAQGQLTSFPGGTLPKFKPIREFMVVLITYKNKEEPIKNEGARVVTRFSML